MAFFVCVGGGGSSNSPSALPKTTIYAPSRLLQNVYSAI